MTKEFILYYDPTYPLVDFNEPSTDDFVDGAINEVFAKKEWHFDDYFKLNDMAQNYYECEKDKILKFKDFCVRCFPKYYY